MQSIKKTVFICGRYGSGKTTVTLNFAIYLRKENYNVDIVDLDVVNPCFRVSDCKKLLTENGIKVFAPDPGDIEINDEELIPPTADEINRNSCYVIADVGDDKEGYEAFSGLIEKIKPESYDILYVINFTKSSTNSVEKAAADIANFEKVTGGRVNGIINTTHAAGIVDMEMLMSSEKSLNALAKKLRINMLWNCCDASNKSLIGDGITPLTIYEKPLWL